MGHAPFKHRKKVVVTIRTCPVSPMSESWCVWEVEQPRPVVSGETMELVSSRCDVILIRIMLWKIHFVECSNITSEELVVDRQIKAIHRKQQDYYQNFSKLYLREVKSISKILSSIGLSKEERSSIIQKLNEVVQVAVPLIPIVVNLRDTTMQKLGAAVPATPSAMIRLEKVIPRFCEKQVRNKKLKILGLTMKGAKSVMIPSSRNTCVLCSKLFKYDGVEQLTRFPACLHLFHGDCLNKWLLATDVCPVCQCTLEPTTTTTTQTSFSGSESHNKLLMVSSAVIVGTLLCNRLLKQCKD